MMQDLEKYGLVFSPDAPYELLSSNTFSIADILFCERYYETYERLSELGAELVRRFARAAGGLSAFVCHVMASGALDRRDRAELDAVLADVMLRGSVARTH
jgi:hypothetical protein